MAASIQANRPVCAISDLDGDRQADYALLLNIAGQPSRPAAISVHLSSTPEALQLDLPAGVVAASFIFRDVNGDGRPDIALLGGGNETVGVFLNDGSGRFQFNHDDRYLTGPSRDRSQLSPPSGACPCECAETGSGSSSAVFDWSGLSHGLPTASAAPTASRPGPARHACGVAHSRAP